MKHIVWRPALAGLIFCITLALLGTSSPASIGPLGEAVNRMAIDPTDSNIIYAATRSAGMLKSTDGGTGWSVINNGLTDLDIGALGIARQDPNRLYLSTTIGVFRSTDAGASWSGTGPISGQPFWAVAVAPNDPDTVYAGTTTSGLFKTTDGGANWVAISEGLTNRNMRSIIIHPQDVNTLYAGTNGGGVFKSTDAGAQ